MERMTPLLPPPLIPKAQRYFEQTSAGTFWLPAPAWLQIVGKQRWTPFHEFSGKKRDFPVDHEMSAWSFHAWTIAKTAPPAELFAKHMKEFMTPGTVTNAHVKLAMWRLKMERSSHVLVKFGKGASTSTEAFNDENSSFEFLFYHIHDIGHQLKNAQASLEGHSFRQLFCLWLNWLIVASHHSRRWSGRADVERGIA